MKTARIFLVSVSVFCLVTGGASAFSVGGIHFSPIDFQGYHSMNVNSGGTQELAAAERFVGRLTQEGIGFLGAANLTDVQRAAKFRALLKKSFDMKTIGRFALGSYWRSASSAQQREYLGLFEEMIIQVYSKRFGDYNGEAITVSSSRPEGKYDILVTSHIVPVSGEKIQVDWRVRKKGGGYKVVDVVVEGVSMGVTQRSDFSSVIQRGGGNVDVLLEHLR